MDSTGARGRSNPADCRKSASCRRASGGHGLRIEQSRRRRRLLPRRAPRARIRRRAQRCIRIPIRGRSRRAASRTCGRTGESPAGCHLHLHQPAGRTLPRGPRPRSRSSSVRPARETFDRLAGNFARPVGNVTGLTLASFGQEAEVPPNSEGVGAAYVARGGPGQSGQSEQPQLSG